MAHELLIEDGQAAMMYVGKVPWHGLGFPFANAPGKAKEVIKAAQLDWKVLKIPLSASDGEHWYQVPDRVALVPSHRWGQPDCPMFGVAFDTYSPLQNEDAFQFFDPLVENGVASYETAGALGNGERVWVLAKIKQEVQIVGDDTITKYILLVNGHDAKTAVRVLLTPVRVVCQNTLTMAFLDSTTLAALYHEQGLRRRMETAFENLNQVLTCYDDLAESFRRMVKVRLDDTRLSEYLGGVFPEPSPPSKGKKTAERYERELAEVKASRVGSKRLFNEGRGNDAEQVRGSLWAAYNGVVEWVDQHILYPNRQGRFTQLFFGDAFQTKTRALQRAVDGLEKWKN